MLLDESNAKIKNKITRITRISLKFKNKSTLLFRT